MPLKMRGQTLFDYQFMMLIPEFSQEHSILVLFLLYPFSVARFDLIEESTISRAANNGRIIEIEKDISRNRTNIECS